MPLTLSNTKGVLAEAICTFRNVTLRRAALCWHEPQKQSPPDWLRCFQTQYRGRQMDAPKPARITQQKPEQIIERLHRHITPSLLQLKAQLQQAGQAMRQ